MDKLFVYGTLRSGEKATHSVRGTMYAIQGLFGFPGVVVEGDAKLKKEHPIGVIHGNLKDVDPSEWNELDSYEGIRGKDEKDNLYKRIKITTLEGEKAYMYVPNFFIGYMWTKERCANLTVIKSGDWIKHLASKKEKGFNASYKLKTASE